MIIKNNFINTFDDLSKHSKVCEFKKEVNDIDGASYPAISFDIPVSVRAEFITKIEETKGFKINPKLVFLRANPYGKKEPYQAHNDLNMADYTCILYLTSVGGTSFVKHIESGMDENNPDLCNLWLKDCNKKDAWEVVDFCEMKPNRAVIFDAKKMHRGEPIEGYGQGADSRMIMVCFFDRAKNDN